MIDRNKLLGGKRILVKTERYVLSLMEERFRDDYMAALGLMTSVDDTEREIIWQELNNENNISFAILDETNGRYMGYCQYKSINGQKPDIGIELMSEYHGKGLGYDICSTLVSVAFGNSELDAIYYRTFRNNTVSIALAKKLGAVLDGTEYVHERLLTALYKMADEDGRCDKTRIKLIMSLEKYHDDLKIERGEDILIYRIDRENWNNKKSAGISNDFRRFLIA